MRASALENDSGVARLLEPVPPKLMRPRTPRRPPKEMLQRLPSYQRSHWFELQPELSSLPRSESLGAGLRLRRLPASALSPS